MLFLFYSREILRENSGGIFNNYLELKYLIFNYKYWVNMQFMYIEVHVEIRMAFRNYSRGILQRVSLRTLNSRGNPVRNSSDISIKNILQIVGVTQLKKILKFHVEIKIKY